MEGFTSMSTSISIHSLRMEGDEHRFLLFGKLLISIHSLRMEGDLVASLADSPPAAFQSTPSAWRETCVTSSRAMSRR